MRILFIGDIVGRPGRRGVREALPSLVSEFGFDLVIANCENTAGGFGITPETAEELFRYGIHIMTSGNHIWDKRESYRFLDEERRVTRPLNYPEGVPGRGYVLYPDELNPKVAVVNLEGRVFMDPLDCPFSMGAKIIEELRKRVGCIIVDFHAEATSEKVALGRYLDGKVTAVVGTHTHIQTADERILPGGTAYITDVGMTGPLDSVIGVKTEIIIQRFLTQLPSRFEIASGPIIFSAVGIDADETGRAEKIWRIYREIMDK